MSLLDPHSFNDDTQPAAQALNLKLRVDFERRVLEGSITLSLERAAGGPLDLDTRGLTVHAVTNQAGTPVPFALDVPDPILGTRLRLQLPDGTTDVTLHYATSPDAMALQWLTPQQTAGKQHPYLFSQCQAIHARSLAPLQDSPRVRIRYHAEITVPAALTAVMAAASSGSRKEPDGSVTFLFDMPQPIPSYLIALAVGNITSQDLSARSRVYAEPEILAAAASEFSGVEKMVSAAETLFGPYPWDRFDMLVMPPSFPYGGMENPRLTFLTPTLLAGDKSLVNVVVHELSHSWTGNLVTNASLEHFWLNEGFTVYAEQRLIELLDGPETAALHDAMSLTGLLEDMQRLGMTSPLTRLRTQLKGKDPDEVYSQVPYVKGCLLLQRIEQHVGRPAFDRFLAAYIQRFRFKSITTDDFLDCLHKELPGTAQQLAVMRWIDGEGLPDDAPKAVSAQLGRLETVAHAFGKGVRPDVATLKAFGPNDWQVLLPRLPDAVTVADCAWLDEHFQLSTHGNAEIRVAFLTHAARTRYAAAYPAVEKTLKTVGRMKYLRPLYSALRDHPDTLVLARRWFEEAKAGYHPVARHVMEGVLAKAA